METLAKTYEVEAEYRKRKMGAEERLRRHKEEGGPVMEALGQEYQERMDQKRIKPNSGVRASCVFLKGLPLAFLQA